MSKLRIYHIRNGETEYHRASDIEDDCRIELDCWDDKDCRELIVRINQVLGE